jgi:hypothetical protein
MTTAAEIIAQLGLLPHPEGGWYRETWRDPATPGQRGCGTAIYYLLEAGQRSHWHRVDAVEIWHAYAGDGFELQLWDGQGAVQNVKLGADLQVGPPQLIIPAGVWQAATPRRGDHGWALAGCTVAPAFEFAGFEMAAADWRPGGLEGREEGDPPRTSRCAGAIDVDTPLAWPPSRHLGGADVSGTWSWRAGESPLVHGSFVMGPAAEGLPGHVHGGLAAALCDEAMGWATWMSGYVAPGARVVLDYLGPLRAGDEVELQANLERVDGRNLFLKAELRVDGRAKVRAHGRFVAVTPRDWTAFAGWPGLERFLEA